MGVTILLAPPEDEVGLPLRVCSDPAPPLSVCLLALDLGVDVKPALSFAGQLPLGEWGLELPWAVGATAAPLGVRWLECDLDVDDPDFLPLPPDKVPRPPLGVVRPDVGVL